MRLFNPEWEAIKAYEHLAKVREAQFDLDGQELDEDHAQALLDQLLAHLPWLPESALCGVHPIQGASSGQGTLIINRRAKLTLRLPVADIARARALCGARLDLGRGLITVGNLKEKPLTPFSYQYAHRVSLGVADEGDFLAAARAEFDALGVKGGGLIPGKPWRINTARGERVGYSLLLHDISLDESIAVQEAGIGEDRLLGCGIFTAHKSIKDVALG